MRRRSAIASRAAVPACSAIPGKNLWYYANTDNRKALSFFYNGGHWADTKNSARHDINPGVNWRATSSMSLNLGLRYFINHDDSQWVENEDLEAGGQRYVFGRIDQKTVSFTTRFNYTMTPNLSLQVYAEPFVSAPANTRTTRSWSTAAPRSTRTATSRTRTAAAPTSTSARSARPTCCAGNTVPARSCSWSGSRASRTSSEYGDFRFGRDFGGVFSAPSRNVFLIKFSYWLNM